MKRFRFLSKVSAISFCLLPLIPISEYIRVRHAILGTWKERSGNGFVSYFSDGTIKFEINDLVAYGTYKIQGLHHIHDEVDHSTPQNGSHDSIMPDIRDFNFYISRDGNEMCYLANKKSEKDGFYDKLD